MAKQYEIESDFFHRGQRCLVLKGDWRCGYVGIKPEHPLYGVRHTAPAQGEDKPNPVRLLDCHGGVTYSGRDWPVANEGLWWFGFDTDHQFDRRVERRSLEYVTAGVIKLADQLADLEIPK